jgi:copper chaperone CopZ
MNTMKLSIQGMGCGHCTGRVRKALTEVEGVQVERVEIGTADIRYDSSRVTPERIRQAVEDAGYKVLPAEAVA